MKGDTDTCVTDWKGIPNRVMYSSPPLHLPIFVMSPCTMLWKIVNRSESDWKYNLKRHQN